MAMAKQNPGKKLKVTLVKSTDRHARATTAPACAGWACAGSTTRSKLEDTPAVRGMINKVRLPGEVRGLRCN